MTFEISPKSIEMELNWEEANLYCQFLECDGYGWRLPNRHELTEIYKLNNELIRGYYWSGAEYSHTDAWGLYFNNGQQNNILKTASLTVRPIRDVV